MVRVFLSYARGDDGEPFDASCSFVARLHHDLTAVGFEVWFDRQSMPSRNLTFHQEIRDAVSACDRLVLIVGPRAAASDYVRQEWQYAYFQADKVVTPILRHGDFPLVPDELKLLHCEDFRDDAKYAFHLEQLKRILNEPPPPLGKLIAVPALPSHFLSRTDRIVALRDALRADLDRPVVISGASARVGLHGMGGIGKSVLAAALAHDRLIRQAFPDGIVWVGLGPLLDVAALQRRVHLDLGGDGAIANEHEGKVKLKELLAEKAVLLVIDDVWRRADVDAFDVLGPKCRAMITTRDSGLLSSLGGTHHVVELLTEAEALHLLAQAAGVAIDALPADAQLVVGECGRLPLAVSLAGGMVQSGTPWRDVLDALREHELEFLEDGHAAIEQHRNLWRTIEVSVRALPEAAQQRLAELAVFPTDEAVPEAAVVTLWTHTGGLSPRNCRKLLVDLKQRSLVQLTASQVGLHDLIHDFCVRLARKTVGDDSALHTRLLDAYRRQCPSGWWIGPNDGYFLDHLRTHLVAAGHGGELADLLHELRWLEAKNAAGLTFDLTHDFSQAITALPADDNRGGILKLLDEALRRDIHFIARHADDYPQALFQCLWNSCSWHDNPEAASHYREPVAGQPRQAPATPSPGQWSPMLQEWHEARISHRARQLWLLSLRPPPMPLSTAQRSVLRGHENKVTSVSHSANGRRIASGSADGTVRVWDADSGAALTILLGRLVTSVSYSADGRRIASGSADGTVRVWDADSGAELAVLRGHEDWVMSVSYSADGRRIASASKDNTVRVWDADSGAELAVLRGHEDDVTSVSYSADGRRIASAAWDRTVRVWNPDTGAELAVLREHASAVMSVSYSPNGRRIASGSYDNTVRMWDAENGAELAVLRGHERSVESVSYSGDGRRIASASVDRTVRVWDAENGAELADLRGHDHSVTSVSYSPDGRRIASGSYDSTVRVWDTDSGAVLAVLRGHKVVVESVSYSPNGRRIVSGSYDNTVRVWDADSGAELAVLRGHERKVESVSYSPDGRRIASGSWNDTVRVWDAQTFECREVIAGSHDAAAIVAGNERFPWQAIARGLETVIEDATGNVVARFPHALKHIATHPSGRQWAGSLHNHVYLIALEGPESSEGTASK